MKLHLDQGAARYRITRYGAGSVTVNGEVLSASLIVTEAELVRDWEPQSFEDLAPAHFERLVALGPELVILGSGRRQRFPDATVLAPLAAAGIGVEVMDTGAACRTFNILAGEGRRVAAALLMMSGAQGA